MERIKQFASKIGFGLFIIIFLFFGLKGCVVTIWKSPSEPTTYAVHGEDGRSLAMLFMPKNETYIIYTEKNTGFIEVALTKMRGSFGTHYFGRLWSLDGPGTGDGLFGYRIYPEGAEPVVMETTVKNKFTHGNGDPTLRSIGDRTHPVILFKETAVRFEDMWLEKEPTNLEFLTMLNQRLKNSQQ